MKTQVGVMERRGPFFTEKLKGRAGLEQGGLPLSIHTSMYASIKKAIADADQERRQDHARRMALLKARIEAVRRMGAVLDAYQDGKKTLVPKLVPR
jgi:hypothetical protein